MSVYYGCYKPMKCNVVVLLWVLLLCVPVQAQIELVPATGVVGEKVRVPVVLYGNGGDITVRALLRLSNPSVLYPEQLVEVHAGALLSKQIVRQSDSVWSIEFQARYQSGDTVCALEAEMLAGSAAQCTLSVDSVEANQQPWKPTSAVVLATSVGTPLPYVRFARLGVNFPNPAVPGETTTWVYRIDKASAVELSLHTLDGREIDRLRFGVQQPGLYKVPYRVSIDWAAGVYWAQLWTGSGLSFQTFMVMPQ